MFCSRNNVRDLINVYQSTFLPDFFVCFIHLLVHGYPTHHTNKVRSKDGTFKRFYGLSQHHHFQRKGGDSEAPLGMAPEPHITNEDSLDDMPNTVGPNPNIIGGFPENDVWGNFELPNPETIDRLKLALKLNHHRPMYAGENSDFFSFLKVHQTFFCIHFNI